MSLSSWILSVEAKSCLFLTSYRTMGRCLFRAGPKLFEAFLSDKNQTKRERYFKFSIAAMKIALLEDVKHFYRRVMLVLTNCARTEFSSTIILGSKIKLQGVIRVIPTLTKKERN
jgi:hypothetical protein